MKGWPEMFELFEKGGTTVFVGQKKEKGLGSLYISWIGRKG